MQCEMFTAVSSYDKVFGKQVFGSSINRSLFSFKINIVTGVRIAFRNYGIMGCICK